VDADLTLAEAVTVLDPPCTEKQLRAIIRALAWEPSGHRHTGRAGHPSVTYPAEQIMRLHRALSPFLRG
jgi:hypothetical protein